MHPLFYDKPLLLSAGLHSGLRLRNDLDCRFAILASVVPLTLQEFGLAARFYPICFAGAGQPVAMLGLREGENLYVGEDGRWRDGVYIPAYVRRYPFILMETGTNESALAMQDDPEVIAREGGWALFDERGPSEEGLRAYEFCRNYKAAADATSVFVKALDAAGLLIERIAVFDSENGGSTQVEGFRIVDEERLRALDGAVLERWMRRDWLAPVFAHVTSMNLWPELFAEGRKRAAARSVALAPKVRSRRAN